MERIPIEIPFVLSTETASRYTGALTKVQNAKDQRNGKVVDVKIDKDQNNNPIGIVVMEVDLG